MSSDEVHYADRANTYDYINWKPAANWADADGGNASVNASIKKAADNIKAIASHKIFLTVWHEPENDVSSFDTIAEQTACKNSPSFTGLKGAAGTPAQYRAMWQNVRNIFNAEGVHNVVWVMNYMGYKNWDCLIPAMWPGNNLVDWVTMDSYGTGSNPTWGGSVGRIYNVLQAASNPTDNFDSKPWGSAEFNACSNTDANVASYFASAKSALDANAYPRLKLYMVFDSANGPGGTSGCLVDRDATVLNAFKSFANDKIFTTNGTPTPQQHPPVINSFNAYPTTVTKGGSSRLSWSTSNTTGCSVYPNGPRNTTATNWSTPSLLTIGKDTYTLTCGGSNGTSVSKNALVNVSVNVGGGGGGGSSGDTVPPVISQSEPSNGSKVSGSITVEGAASDNVGVSFVSLRIDNKFQTGLNKLSPVDAGHGNTYAVKYNTKQLKNGKHSLYLRAWDAAGNHTDTKAITINVQNHHWWWPW